MRSGGQNSLRANLLLRVIVSADSLSCQLCALSRCYREESANAQRRACRQGQSNAMRYVQSDAVFIGGFVKLRATLGPLLQGGSRAAGRTRGRRGDRPGLMRCTRLPAPRWSLAL